MKNLFLNLLLSADVKPLEGTVADVPEGLLDRLIYGLEFSAIGIVVVFIVLIILMIVIKVFELCFYKKNAPAQSVAVIGPDATPVAPAAPAASSSTDDDAMLAAVIAAAVDAYYDNVQAQANVPVHARKKYQIRSFRKI